MNYELIMLVISSRNSRYDRLITNYWIPLINFIKDRTDIKIFLIFGDELADNKFETINDNILICPNTETFVPGILIKTLFGFEYINKNYSYNKLLRTNLSSFFIIDNLIKQSLKLENDNLYAGVIGHYHKFNSYFCSGAGFWCSKNIIELIIENKQKLKYDEPDDVAIGLLFSKTDMTPLNRVDLVYNRDYADKNLLLNNIIDLNHYHIRLKNKNNESLDIQYATAFTKMLY